MHPCESKPHAKPLSLVSKMTQIRGNEEQVVGSPSSFGEYFRHRIRSRSNTSQCSDENSNSYELFDIEESEGYESASSPLSPNSDKTPPMPINNRSKLVDHGYFSNHSLHNNQLSNPILIQQSPSVIPKIGNRIRNDSYCLDSAFTSDEAVNFFNSRINKPRASCVQMERNFITLKQQDSMIEYDDEDDHERMIKNIFEEEESILGKIHLELCKYHEVGRFLVNPEIEEYNKEAAFFHLKQAANLGVTEALINIAKIYLQLPHDVLSEFTVEPLEINFDIGFEYMLQSADKGDLASIFFIAKAYDTGVNLSKTKEIDWLKALEYYQKILNKTSDDDVQELTNDCDPSYQILARMAEMNMKGGYNLEKDPSEAASLFTEAAEKAMLFGKGRLANKYYQQAEEASAMSEDDSFE